MKCMLPMHPSKNQTWFRPCYTSSEAAAPHNTRTRVWFPKAEECYYERTRYGRLGPLKSSLSVASGAYVCNNSPKPRLLRLFGRTCPVTVQGGARLRKFQTPSCCCRIVRHEVAIPFDEIPDCSQSEKYLLKHVAQHGSFCVAMMSESLLSYGKNFLPEPVRAE